MAQFVSKRHKEIAEILRKEYGDKLITWPNPEVNIGKLAGVHSIINLRCDFFIWIDKKTAVALEYHSDIHTDKIIFNSNLEAIKGRDEMKREMLSRLGIGQVEIFQDDPYDIKTLKKRIDKALKEFPEITFTRRDLSGKLNTEINTNLNIRGATKWQSRKLVSNKKMQSRPFKRS